MKSSRSSRRSRQVKRGTARSLHHECLEDRRLLALGDLLRSFENEGDLAQSAAEFGAASDVHGDRLIVGAPLADASGFSTVGEAYVFDTLTGDLLLTIPNPLPATGDRFGSAVAISESWIVVGNQTADVGATDAGVVHVFDATSGALLHTVVNPTPNNFDYFGSAVAIDGSTIVVGAYLDDTAFLDAGAAYLIDANSGLVQHTLTRPNAAQFDFTGFSVAITGNRVIVGASRADIGGLNDGEVLVFDATTGALTHTLVNPTPADADNFGHTVAVTPNRIAVGAYRDPTGAVNSGAAYTFDLQTGDLQQTFLNPSPAIGDNFGWSVDILGDLLLVGAYRDDLGARDAGTAYLFNVETGIRLRTFANPTPAELDYFGTTVSLSGTHSIVGARWDDTLALDAGRVYMFDSATGQLAQEFNSPANSSSDYFGHDVAVNDEHLVIGAYLDDTIEVDSGIVRIYDPATGALRRTFVNPVAAAYDAFGYSVAVSGNVLAVGAFADDQDNIVDSGTVYLFDILTGDLLQTVRSPLPASQDYFGYSLSLSGEFLAVGAPRVDELGVIDTGQAYVFDVTSGVLLQQLANPSADAFDSFGHSVAVNLNGMVVVGAPFDDSAGGDAGAAYVFDAWTGELITSLAPVVPEPGSQFGASVATRGNRTLIGAPRKDLGGFNAGAAYLMDVVTGNTIKELGSPTARDNAFFGHDVAMSDDYIAVGAYGASVQGVYAAGAAYLYESATGLFRSELNSPAVPTSSDYFGWSVALGVSYAAIGAPLVNGTSFDRGAAYIFDAGIAIDLPPIAVAGGPYIGVEGQPLMFDASGSSDTPNDLGTLTFEWDLDYDGITFDVDEAGIAPTVQFDDDVLVRDIALRVTDTSDQSTIDLALLEILNADPLIDASSGIVSVDEGQSATNHGSFSDVPSDSVSLSASLGEVTDNFDGTWSWSFDTTDGPDEGQTIIITATDDDGGFGTVEFELVVNNVAPTINAEFATLTVLAGDIASNLITVADVGDDTVTVTANIGVVTDEGNGLWRWTSTDTTTFGTQSIQLTATDSDGAMTPLSFDVLVRLVIAGDDAVSGVEGDTLLVAGRYQLPDLGESVTLTASVGTVVDNLDGTWGWSWAVTDGPDQSQVVMIQAEYTNGPIDATSFDATVLNAAPSIAVDATSVSLISGGSVSNSGTVSDAGQDDVSLTASLGVVLDNGDGTWSWSYDDTISGTVTQTVTITATDSDGDSSEASFELNGELIAADNGVISTGEGSVATNTGRYAVLPDGDTVVLSASIGNVLDNGDGTWSWDWVAGDGPDSTTIVTITADYVLSGMATIDFDVDVANLSPELTVDNDTVEIDEGDTAQNGGTIVDLGGDAVTLTASIGEVLDNGDGTWSWSYSAINNDENQLVTVFALDDEGAEGMITFDLVVNNVVPILTVPHVLIRVAPGAIATIMGSILDVGGDPVSLSANQGTVIDNLDGTWEWSLDTTEMSSQSIVITALDSDGGQSELTFYLLIGPTLALKFPVSVLAE